MSDGYRHGKRVRIAFEATIQEVPEDGDKLVIKPPKGIVSFLGQMLIPLQYASPLGAESDPLGTIRKSDKGTLVVRSFPQTLELDVPWATVNGSIPGGYSHKSVQEWEVIFRPED